MSTAAAKPGSEEAGPGDTQTGLSPESAGQRDGPCAKAGIQHELPHRSDCGNTSAR